MKARVKATGEIIEVIPYDGFDEYDFYEPETKLPWLKSALVFDVTDKDAIYNKGWQDGLDEAVKSEIPKIHPRLKGSDPDYWTRLEHTYAGMAMQGILSNPELFKATAKNAEEFGLIVPTAVAIDANCFAHALIQKLKEKEERK